MRALISQWGSRRAWLSIGGLGLLTVLILALLGDGQEDENRNAKPISAELTSVATPQMVGDAQAKNVHDKEAPLLSAPDDPKPGDRLPVDSKQSKKTLDGIAENFSMNLVKQAENAILQNLSTEDKVAALRRLEAIDDPMVISPVLLAMDDPDASLRKAALDVVKDLDHEEVNTVLLLGLEDDDLEVVEKTIRILQESESSSTLPSLEQALLDDDERVQSMAVSTLEDIPDPGAIDILIESGLRSSDVVVHKEIFDTLEFLTSQRFTNYEEASAWWNQNRETFTFD